MPTPDNHKEHDQSIQTDHRALDVNDSTNTQEPEMFVVDADNTTDHFSDEMPVEPVDADTRKTTKTPLPPLIKFGLPALIVIIFITVGLAANNIISDDGVDLATPHSFEIGGAPIQPGSHAPVIGEPGLFSSDEQLSGIESDIDALRLKITSFQKTTGELHIQLETLRKSVTKRIDVLHTLFITVTDDTVPSLLLANQQHTTAINELRGSISKNKQRINQATKRKAETPPFALLSIDEWGTTTSAVLEMAGKTSVASVGDVRAGWRITKIVRPDCIYAVRVTGGKAIKICGTGVF